ncbi:hypothetical protein AVEN_46788-1 [Araneus ventricosus]|uniref:Uncharacterized protein n=1 Tax=Araneus ventricosus TaxID=182803 RepID=A0A4Y2WTM3_ARAVE|nr:hypothetical protein AVEN_46788-1 [Araneus ventricosus]
MNLQTPKIREGATNEGGTEFGRTTGPFCRRIANIWSEGRGVSPFVTGVCERPMAWLDPMSSGKANVVYEFNLIVWSEREISFKTCFVSNLRSKLTRLFPVGLFEVQGLSWWGPNVLWAALNIPGDMLLLAIENVLHMMQCVVHKKGGHIEKSNRMVHCNSISVTLWGSSFAVLKW